MTKKTIKYSLMFLVLIGIFFSQSARADLIMPIEIISPFVTLMVGIFLGTAIEIAVGYLIFFRNNIPGLKALMIANLISYPIFFVIFRALILFSSNPLFLVALETGVVVSESIIIKIYLKDTITFKRALFISLVLNVISAGIGILFMAILNILSFL